MTKKTLAVTAAKSASAKVLIKAGMGNVQAVGHIRHMTSLHAPLGNRTAPEITKQCTNHPDNICYFLLNTIQMALGKRKDPYLWSKGFEHIKLRSYIY